jgi:hypothetical protein
MLSTILTTLQSLISPSFVIASFFPMLAFWLMNVAMLYWICRPFKELIARLGGASSAIQNTMWAGGFLIVTAMTAYILSALIPKFQAWMEGKWQWDTMVHWFAPAQGRRLGKIDEQIREVTRYRTELENKLEVWRRRLQDAAEWGRTHQPGHNTFTAEDDAAEEVQKLVRLSHANRRLDLSQVENAVVKLENVLRANDYNAPVPKRGWPLAETFQKLQKLVETAKAREGHNHIRLQTESYFSFGTQDLSPTKMGNIANTIQSYAIDRYNMNLAVFWSRLQNSVAGDKDFSSKLESVRTKLEFLIGCSGLTAIWGALWGALFLVFGYEWIAFVCAAAGGPLIAYIWYRVATEHYKAYADVLRSSVDLFRFGLLKDLHLSLPADVDAEKTLWDQLHGLTAYYDENNLRFDHPKS